MLGICNGFQVLCEAGLLPGALLPNVNPAFTCRQVDLTSRTSRPPFTHACAPGERLCIPAKHTTGRYFAPTEMLDALEADGPGACCATPRSRTSTARCTTSPASQRARNVFGLMPHPEHAVDPLTGSTTG